MKKVIQSIVLWFLIGATVTGSVYRLIENPKNESMLKIISFNFVLLVLATAISVLGYYSSKKKDK